MKSFASKIDISTLDAAACGARVENPSLTFAELVAAYCGQAKPNEPRNYPLKKWKTWLGAEVAWRLSEAEHLKRSLLRGWCHPHATVSWAT